jgi:hypothetical protein
VILAKIAGGSDFSPLLRDIGSPGIIKKSANIKVTAAQTTMRLCNNLLIV